MVSPLISTIERSLKLYKLVARLYSSGPISLGREYLTPTYRAIVQPSADVMMPRVPAMTAATTVTTSGLASLHVLFLFFTPNLQ